MFKQELTNSNTFVYLWKEKFVVQQKGLTENVIFSISFL
jgi:hypothetical protein